MKMLIFAISFALGHCASASQFSCRDFGNIGDIGKSESTESKKKLA